MSSIYNRNTKLIYRDLIRLVRTVMDKNKQIAVLPMIRKEFEKNKNMRDGEEILKLKMNACKSIADLYLYYVKNTMKDSRDNPNRENLL
jgi:hypothetical protein